MRTLAIIFAFCVPLAAGSCKSRRPDPSLFPGVGYDDGFYQGFSEGLGYKRAIKDFSPTQDD